MDEKKIRPFLKWAGGKRWLIESSQFPKIEKFKTYIEPFLGSGSVFFSLSPAKSILADKNAELINCYQAIKSEAELVRRYLVDHKRQHSEDYYYAVRAQQPRSAAKRAARFIYLNRSCWNGLYRVNLKGIFNVPRGTKNSIVFEDDDFVKVAARLKNTEITCADFEVTIAKAKLGDLIFADPPYTVLHNTNGFVKYNEKIFNWDDQVRLRDSLLAAARRGAQVYLTNADHDSVRELYASNSNVLTIHRFSKISGDAKGRRPTTELLVQVLGAN
jgi:DNA adenine methylase